MAWNVPLTEAGTAERSLPPIWPSKADQEKHGWAAYNEDRIEFYLRFCDSRRAFQDCQAGIVDEFAAAMIGESGLQNFMFGDAAPSANFGFCFWQADTRLPGLTVEDIHLARTGPDGAIDLLFSKFERATAKENWLVDVRPGFVEFNKERWHAWDPDVFAPREGWSPIKAVQAVRARL